MNVFALADRLGCLPDEIRQMDMDDFIKFLAFYRLRERDWQQV